MPLKQICELTREGAPEQMQNNTCAESRSNCFLECLYVARARAGGLYTETLFDCCWVELDGFQRPQLVVQMRMKPPIFAIGPGLYDERGRAMATHADAPRVLVIYNTTISPRRMLA